MNILLRNFRWVALTGLLGAVLAAPAFAAKQGHVERTAGVLPVTTTTISGTPLRIVIGNEHSYQIFNSAIPGVGQMYPSDSTDTGDMGWMVRLGTDLYAPDYSNHSEGTATSSLGTYTAFTPGTVSPVSGDGSAGNPYSVTVTSSLGGSGVVASENIRYVNGQNYFQKRFTLTNNGAASQDARVFLGGDIYLAGQDSGIPYREIASSSPGGQDCNSPATYFILYIPQTPATAWTGAGYSNLWSQIGAGQLDSALEGTSCIDNAAGLQWNRTLAAGASVSIEATTSFGDIPDVAQFGISAVNPASGVQGATVNVTISGFGFQPTTTFNFAAGITVSNVSITSATSATATLSIDVAAELGFRDVLATQTVGGLTATLPSGFLVVGQGGGTPTDAVALPVSGSTAMAALAALLALMGMVMFRRRKI